VFPKFLPGSCLTLPASSSSQSTANISDHESSGSKRLHDFVQVGSFVGLEKCKDLFFRGVRVHLPPRIEMRSRGVGIQRPGQASTQVAPAPGVLPQTSCPLATSLAPCLMRVMGPQEFVLVTLPGTAKTSRFCSSAQPAVMRVPLYSAASTTSTPHRHSAYDPVANKKVLRRGKRANPGVGTSQATRDHGGMTFCHGGTGAGETVNLHNRGLYTGRKSASR
jgi:hypothetical protein